MHALPPMTAGSRVILVSAPMIRFSCSDSRRSRFRRHVPDGSIREVSVSFVSIPWPNGEIRAILPFSLRNCADPGAASGNEREATA